MYMLTSNFNWFPTLNESLDSEDLVSYWPLGLNIRYDQTVSVVKDGKYISVYRSENGDYERPVHYATQMEDTHG